MATDDEAPSSDRRGRATVGGTTVAVEAVAATVGAMAGAGIGGPTGAVVGALAGPLASRIATLADGALSRLVLGTQQARIQKLLSRLTGQTSAERQDQALILMLDESEDFKSAILAAIRASLDVLTDAAIPILADLLKQYTRKAPDAFFRGVAEVLRAVSNDELRQLRLLAGALSSALLAGPGPDWNRITVRVNREREGEPWFLSIVLQTGTSTETLDVGRIDDESAFEAAIRLLEANGILAETGSAFSPRNFAIYRRIASRLARLLALEPSALEDGG
jgi:hypothetical protein